MREIRFRAWDKRNNKMLSLNYQDGQEYVMVINTGEVLENGNGVFYPTEQNLVLMQFTGLEDKNGTEIYEGDIVKLDSKNSVVSKDVVIAVEITPEKGVNFQTYDLERCWIVIGNIYEDPELLK